MRHLYKLLFLLFIPIGSISLAYAQTTLSDHDGDGIPDIYDIDDDNDGILDIIEAGYNFNTTAYNPFGNNLVVNGNFANNHPAAPFPKSAGTDLGGWSSGIAYAGNNVYPEDTRVSIQSGNMQYMWNAYYNDYVVKQKAFPGDPANNVPASNTYLYSNGNTTSGSYTIWKQTISGLSANTTYRFVFYTSNLSSV